MATVQATATDWLQPKCVSLPLLAAARLEIPNTTESTPKSRSAFIASEEANADPAHRTFTEISAMRKPGIAALTIGTSGPLAIGNVFPVRREDRWGVCADFLFQLGQRIIELAHQA